MSTPVPLTLEEWRAVHREIAGRAQDLRAHCQALSHSLTKVPEQWRARICELEALEKRLEPFTRDPRDKRAGEAA